MNKKRMAIITLLAALGLLLIPNKAEAHHPELEITEACSDSGKNIITANVYAWERYDDGRIVSDDRRHNPHVEVTYSSPVGSILPKLVGEGSFVPENNYRFTVRFEVPTELRVITVRATAQEDWGPNGEYRGDGEFREATITLTKGCFNSTTTTPVSTTGKTTVGGEIIPATPIVIRDNSSPPAEAIVSRPRFTG